jgi:hypothetical protein
VDGTPVDIIACDRQFRLPAAGPLALTGKFPTTAATGDRAVVGETEVSAQRAVRGVVTRSAEVFLVREGRVVTTPAVQDSAGVRLDLMPGKAERLPGEATLVSCQPGGGPVPAGTYELYARVVLILDDGARVESFGGPWPLQVR